MIAYIGIFLKWSDLKRYETCIYIKRLKLKQLCNLKFQKVFKYLAATVIFFCHTPNILLSNVRNLSEKYESEIWVIWMWLSTRFENKEFQNEINTKCISLS